MCTIKSNQTYSIDGDENEDDINDFFILNNNNNEQITTGGILQTSTNHDRQMVKKRSCDILLRSIWILVKQ
jgi:hypothetical protein